MNWEKIIIALVSAAFAVILYILLPVESSKYRLRLEGEDSQFRLLSYSYADLDGDGLQETIVALSNKLLIGQVNQKKYTDKAEIEIYAGLNILSLDVADLDDNGLSELYLTAFDGTQLASFVVEYTDNDYAITVKSVKWYLRVVELPGQKQALVGQKRGDGAESFYGKPFHVLFDGDQLSQGLLRASRERHTLAKFDSFELLVLLRHLPGFWKIFPFLIQM